MDHGVLLAAGTDFHGVLQGVVLYIGLPVAGIVGIFAFKAGRTGALITTVIAALLALAFAFGSAATWTGIGQSVADGVSTMLSWAPGG